MLKKLPAFAVTVVLLTQLANSYADAKEDLTICQEMTKAKASLAEGVRQSAQSEVPISAKFELDQHGKLSLSVYTAAKGVAVPAESNVLKEWAGPPEVGRWSPTAETFTDAEHIARASEQLTLLALTSKTLLEILAKAEQEPLGSVYAITPVVRNKRAMFVVLLLQKGKVTELRYDLLTGNKLA
jgi:hypothetical protein